ncbi:MAG: hypothetical protein AABX17_00940 [Nanoarchaeota archaeon]
MGLFNFFKKEQDIDPRDIDYMSQAEDFEKKGDFVSAISEYDKIIQYVYVEKEPKYFRHITKRIINCHLKLGNYEKVSELWALQYDPLDYGAKEMYELIKILEAAGKLDLVMMIYDRAGKPLLRNKIEFLIKQKKIPEANELMNELLASIQETQPGIIEIWIAKAKLSLSLRKWEEANKYLNKIVEKDSHNIEARKLKEFCMKQIRMN